MPIEKKLIYFGILGLFIISIIFTQPAFAIEPECEWELRENNSVRVDQISYDDNHKTFTNIQNPQSRLVELDCTLSDAISLQDKLIDFEFQIKSSRNFETQLSLYDISGEKIFSSPQIMNWYDISHDQKAHIVLDPGDFGLDSSSVSDREEGKNRKINNLKLSLSSNNYESITLSNSKIKTVEDFPKFKLRDNLPIQSTIPAFLGLILISFPLGFVLLSSSNFLKDANFFVKIPWFLGFGFCVYLIIIYLVSHIWISFEVVLGYLVLEFGILFFYLKRNKSFFSNLQIHESKNAIIFFAIILVISGTLAVNYIDAIGWPTGIWDSRIHVATISISMENNQIDYGKSLLPVSDMPGWSGFEVNETVLGYPRGSHVAAAGVAFLTGTLPAVSMESTFAFIIFLIPVMLASIVYKFSKSIFFSSIMFLIVYWVPNRFPGDIMLGKIISSNFAASAGIIVALTCFMIFIAYFEKGNRKKLFFYFGLSIFALIITYYGYVFLPIIIGIIGFLIYYMKDRMKRKIIFLVLIAAFISMPLWSSALLESMSLQQVIPYVYSKFRSNCAFNPVCEIFPLWISTGFGIVSAAILFFSNRYRAFSIVVFGVSFVHLIAITQDLALNYGFFYKALRSVGLMLLLSVAMNLVMLHFLSKLVPLKPSRFYSKLIKNPISKIAILGILVVVLFPGLQIFEDRVEILYDTNFSRKTGSIIDAFPGGNERNLQFWLYENAQPNDLILNEMSNAAQWFIGFRAQNLVNGHQQEAVISTSFNPQTKKWESEYEGSKRALRANEILKHPWDYEKIDQIIDELDIRYIYISERERYEFRCFSLETKGYAPSEGCYPYADNWPWKGYSGNSRIAMYENNPNLELVLRNGNSAVFKVL